MSETTTEFCQKCRQPSDLGAMCRSCYRAWKEALYADIPREQARIAKLFAELRELPAVAKRVAAFILRGQGGPMAGTEADFVRRCKEAMAGPFGGSMDICLTGWLNAEGKATKHKGSLDD